MTLLYLMLRDMQAEDVQVPIRDSYVALKLMLNFKSQQ